MDLKEFLKPSWKKAIIFLAVYIIIIFINRCFLIDLIRQCTMGGCGSGCPTINDFLQEPAFNIASLLLFAVVFPFLVVLVNLKSAPIAITAIAFSYLVACALVHLLAKKEGEAGKRKKTAKK